MERFKVYIINMPKDILRKEKIVSLCESYSFFLDFEVVEAIDGYNLHQYKFDESYNKDIALKYLNRNLTKGEIGCLLSHVFIYHKMLKENIEKALILEDDVIFEQNLLDFLSIVNDIKLDWDILLCGHYSFYLEDKEISSPISFWNRIKLAKGFCLHRLANYGYGTHAYVINNRGASNLLEHLTEFYLPIDHYTNSREFCNVYALNPTVAKVNTNFISGMRRDSYIPWYKKYKILWGIRNLIYYFIPVK